MKLGAHITTSQGLIATAEKANAIGANCIQLFVSPPRNWNPSRWTDQQLLEFKSQLAKLKISPIFLHGIYLVNLHTENAETRQKAIGSVVSYQKIADTIGAVGTIIHSHHPNNTFKSAITEILNKTETVISMSKAVSNPVEIAHSAGNDRVKPLLIIEHSAINTLEDTLSLFYNTPAFYHAPEMSRDNHLGGGRTGVNNRLGFCLDTCHLLAAGYNIRDPQVVDGIISRVDQSIGLDKLKVVHINDAKSQLGSHRDIHQNIGEGSIGKKPFAYWLNHPKLRNTPFIIETPGFDDQGPDQENLNILRSLINC